MRNLKVRVAPGDSLRNQTRAGADTIGMTLLIQATSYSCLCIPLVTAGRALQ
jgi:hypothetical protein